MMNLSLCIQILLIVDVSGWSCRSAFLLSPASVTRIQSRRGFCQRASSKVSPCTTIHGIPLSVGLRISPNDNNVDKNLSIFARSLEETRKRLGLPADLLNESSAVANSSAFEIRVRQAAAAASEEIRVSKNSIIQNITTVSYQRIEEWEIEQKSKAKNGSWEERVQFEGQRYGNQFNQNEILRQHLKF